MTDTTGYIFDIQHFSISDGPGIRTVVFFKGCPLHCSWCHNPESYLARPQIMTYVERCAGCGACVAACPQGIAGMRAKETHWRESCIGCGQCAAVCATGALEMAGRSVTVQKVLADVLEDRPFYRSSGGGITLSGGEPMAQPAFALAVAHAAKAEKLHVAMETSGYCDPAALMAIRPYVDLFLYDYKLTGEEIHRQHTGVGQQRILENLYALDQSGAEIILRCPMIPGINLHQQHEEGIIRVANGLRNLLQIHLEPYHNIGLSKRERLGMPVSGSIEPPDRQLLEAMAERITAATSRETLVM